MTCRFVPTKQPKRETQGERLAKEAKALNKVWGTIQKRASRLRECISKQLERLAERQISTAERMTELQDILNLLDDWNI